MVLKRLADALADGDTIHAVIRGAAINNDGAGKAGFTAPSIAGQAEVIAFGRLALSHRKEGKAPYDTMGLPWHSGRAADVAPLPPGTSAKSLNRPMGGR